MIREQPNAVKMAPRVRMVVELGLTPAVENPVLAPVDCPQLLRRRSSWVARPPTYSGGRFGDREQPRVHCEVLATGHHVLRDPRTPSLKVSTAQVINSSFTG
jgi:hypothetical protein